jgi:hypothetical protein
MHVKKDNAVALTQPRAIGVQYVATDLVDEANRDVAGDDRVTGVIRWAAEGPA